MRLRKDAKAELIKGVPLFSELGRKELEEIAHIADEIDLSEGKELTVQGHAGREFFVLIEGEAAVRQGDKEVNRLGPGDFFGEIALVEDRPRTATVVAESPVRILVITARSFRSLLEHSPEIENKVMSAKTARLSAADEPT
ncbi:MAG TPA: cyclic nucleotide-binding domain-containing protein [Gaiellaceae bacterium]|jgi:CRP-like cAMP-binding protein|nr:cyclic nucleotide-binding domain-containing protein [Gaiellaceae bacterium]HEX2496515.1 cyclic nucleotide-binding domain-containing protein [Gaiellaceae bacterium]